MDLGRDSFAVFLGKGMLQVQVLLNAPPRKKLLVN